MSNKTLSAFLAQNARKVENKKVVASKRFVDENGKPIPWEICCISAGENQKIRQECMKSIQVTGKRNSFTQNFDTAAYQAKLAVRCTVFPDLSDRELKDSYGVMSDEQLIAAMLTPGEFDDYIIAITELCGFTSDGELVEEAKN